MNKPLKLQVEGLDRPLYMRPKVFKSGAVGWHLSEKVTLSDSLVQASLCLVLVGTKLEKAVENLYERAFADPEAPETPQGLFEVKKDPEANAKARKRPKKG
jgi:hypothetical protein